MGLRNYITNGNFDHTSYPLVNVMSSGGANIASRWWAGSGIGGVCTSNLADFPVGNTDVPDYQKRCLNLAWSAAPTSGEQQYAPQIRWTFLEHHIYKAPELFGKTLSYDFYGAVIGGAVTVRQIMWANWSSGDYTIWNGNDHTINDYNSIGWTHVQGTFALPPMPLGKTLDPISHYIGWGLDFTYQTAPNLYLSRFRLWNPAEDVEIRPYELEKYLSQHEPQT